MRYKSKIKPWKHQSLALKQVIKRKSALVWGDVGVGKTKIITDYCIARYQNGDVKRVLIVGPLASVGVWKSELAKHQPPNTMVVTRNDVEQLSELVSGIHMARDWSRSNGALSVVILTYEALTRYAKILGDSYVPDLFIIDESHYIKHYSATRTRRALSVARKSKYVVEASGTPCANGYEELYYQVQAIRPGLLGATFQDFKDQYCVTGGYMGQEIIGYRNRKKLARKLSEVVVRIPKSVLKLPPSIDQVVPVKLDANARSVYDRLKKDLVVELGNGQSIEAPNQLTLLLRLLQVAGGFYEGVKVGQARKLQVLTELAASETEKFIVSAHFQQEISAIQQALVKKGIPSAILRGGTSGKERDKIIETFQTTDKLQALVVQPKAAGISVTLTAAHTMYLYSLTHDPEPYEQVKGRIERGGQLNSCRYIHLAAEDTIDEEVIQAVRSKLSRQEVLGRVVRRLTRA